LKKDTHSFRCSALGLVFIPFKTLLCEHSELSLA